MNTHSDKSRSKSSMNQSSPRQMEFNSSWTSALSGQVLGNGCWKEIHYERAQTHDQPDKGGGDDFQVPIENRWIQHFSPKVKASLALQGAAASTPGSQKSNLGMSCELGSSSEHASRVTDLLFTKWTDEKHQLYIEYMETSFVKQHSHTPVEDSLQNPTSPKTMHCTPTISGQIFQGGCWREICYDTAEPPPRTGQGYDFHSVMKSPWIQRFRAPTKHKGTAPSILQQETSGAYRKFEEMSGQNFDGNDTEGKEAKKISICKNKKMKTNNTTNSSNHQAVSSVGREDVNKNSTYTAENDASNNDEQSRMAGVGTGVSRGQ